MDVYDEIVEWADALPPWQSDALRRIFTKGDLTQEDEEVLYDILRSQHGLGPDKDVRAVPLTRKDISVPSTNFAEVRLLKMCNIENVNALAPQQCLDFEPNGLTLVYGENASGKSGYARVLKRACHARGKAEPVLANVFKEQPSGPAKARFEVSVKGASKMADWQDGRESPEEMRQIAVFDAECSRVYVNERNEVVFTPYGFDAFRKLAALTIKLRNRLSAEATPLQEEVSLPAVPIDTAVGRFVQALSAGTSPEEVARFIAFGPAQEKRLAELTSIMHDYETQDYLNKARQLRARKARLDMFIGELRDLASLVSAEAVRMVKELKEKEHITAEAAKIAGSASFAKEPLSAVGSEVWKAMFLAAKSYSEKEAYVDRRFPFTEEGARCVLCQQLLDSDAASRLRRFNDFISQETEKQAELAVRALWEVITPLSESRADLELNYGELIDFIKEGNPRLREHIHTYLSSLGKRRLALLAACKDGNWESIPQAGEDPRPALEVLSKALESKASKLIEAASEGTITTLRKEKKELEAMKRIAPYKEAIAIKIDRLIRLGNFQRAISAIDTGAISRKSSDLMSSVVTENLTTTLKSELAALGLDRLNVEMKATTREGTTRNQIVLADLKQDYRGDLSHVLSEGEQRVLGIAALLAEMQVCDFKGSVILDDPVCSLDHKWCRSVAKRLVKESSLRQVIVFSHDILFLHDLYHEAEAQSARLRCHALTRDSARTGMLEQAPWEALGMKERIRVLRLHYHTARGAHEAKAQNYDDLARNCYRLLREAWEYAIEETLLNGAVVRYRGEVRPKRLQNVEVTDPDYRAIRIGYSKASEWLHSPGAARGPSSPDPRQLDSDIGELEDFINNHKHAQSAVEKRREPFKDHKAGQAPLAAPHPGGA